MEGTRNVLNAALECSIPKIVLTSSTAAVMGVERPDGHVFTEVGERTCNTSSCTEPLYPATQHPQEDWSDEERQKKNENWYALSKTRAEREAWRIVEEYKKANPEAELTLAVINPTLVTGPLLQPTLNTSSGVVLKYLKGEVEELPNSSMSVVDVRWVL